MSVHVFPSGKKTGRNRASFDPKKIWLGDFLDRDAMAEPQLDLSADIAAAVAFYMNGMMANGPDPQAPAQIQANGGIGDCLPVATVANAAIGALSTGVTLFPTYADFLNCVLQFYHDAAGFDINNVAATDQGTDPTQAWATLAKTGLLLPDGTYYKALGTVQVNWANTAELLLAQSLLGVLNIGINIPQSYESDDVWDATNSPIAGGHEILSYSNLAVQKGGLVMIRSWGEEHAFTEAGIDQNCNQCTGIVWPHSFGAGGANIAGLDQAGLMQALQAVQS